MEDLESSLQEPVNCTWQLDDLIELSDFNDAHEAISTC